jgi:hypothetical protein
MRVPRLQPPARSSGRGWVLFDGLMLLASSALNAAYGFSAIYNDDYLAEESGQNTGWSILVRAVDALIIYGPTTHGFDYE